MFLLLLASFPMMVVGEQAPSSQSAEGLIECRAITDDPRRLACFDRLAGRVASEELVIIDRKKLAQERRRRFGLPAQESGALTVATGGKVPEAQSFSSSIRAARRARDFGRWDIELADGTVWQSIDVSTFPPEAGAAITIKRATLGGYRATVPGRTSFLVKRLR